jgi:UDP-glucose 4-epimerase
MNALVVGGAGFIGRNLCDALHASGHSVYFADTYIHGGKQRKNDPPHAKRSSIDGKKWDAAFYLGGLSSAPMFRSWVNYDTCIHDYAEFLRLAKARRVVVASTSSFYETTPGMEGELIRPKSLYEATKLTFEAMTVAHHRTTGAETAIARFFSVYGPHEEHKGVYANLITQMILAGRKGRAFDIYEKGEQTRDFTYVEDIVAGLTLLAEHPTAGEGEAWNIGTGKSYALKDVAAVLHDRMPGLEVNYPEANPIKNYVKDTLADNAKISNIGWEPQFPLHLGIDRCLEYYTKE